MRRAVAIVAVATLAGCGPKPAASPAPPSPTTVVTNPSPASPAPADYFAQASSLDLYVVRASMLVLNRSGDPDATALAARMLRDHRGLAGQLSLSGRRLNMLPASTLRPREQSWLTQLEAAADPAAAYHQQMEQAHQHSLALHAGFSQRGTSPTLRGVAANAAQVEKRHWTELRRR